MVKCQATSPLKELIGPWGIQLTAVQHGAVVVILLLTNIIEHHFSIALISK